MVFFLCSLAVVLPLPASSSATPTATRCAPRPSSLPRASPPVPSSSAARRPPSPSATFSPLVSSLRVPSSATSRSRLVTVVRLPVPRVTTPPSSDTTPTPLAPVSVSPPAPRSLLPPSPVRLLVSLLVRLFPSIWVVQDVKGGDADCFPFNLALLHLSRLLLPSSLLPPSTHSPLPLPSLSPHRWWTYRQAHAQGWSCFPPGQGQEEQLVRLPSPALPEAIGGLGDEAGASNDEEEKTKTTKLTSLPFSQAQDSWCRHEPRRPPSRAREDSLHPSRCGGCRKRKADLFPLFPSLFFFPPTEEETTVRLAPSSSRHCLPLFLRVSNSPLHTLTTVSTLFSLFLLPFPRLKPPLHPTTTFSAIPPSPNRAHW
jgi:hypothetical protein